MDEEGLAVSQKWTAEQIPSQAGRVAVVTGANSGLGLETSMALAAAGARVIMACRNPAKAANALAEVQQRVPGADVALMTLDLASLASVRAFASEFRDRHSRLDLLINNAGILGVPFSTTVDGFESQIGTNHFGHFALTGLLIDPLLATPGARIVTVCSLGHWRAQALNFDDLHYRNSPYSPFGAYCNSKLANLLFVLELSRRLGSKGSQLVAAAAHPGGAATNISAAKRTALSAAYERIMTPIALRFFINTAEVGALPTLYAATAPGVSNNDYYGPDGFLGLRGYPTTAPRRRSACDLAAAQRLWQLSVAATGVSYLD